MKKRIFRVGTKLLVLLFLVGLVPSGVAIYLLYNGAIATTQEALGYQLLERAHGTMVALDENLALLGQVADHIAEDIRSGATLEHAVAVRGRGIEAVTIIDTSGTVLTATDQHIKDYVELPPILLPGQRRPETFLDETTTGPLAPALRFFVLLPQQRYLVVNVPLEKLLAPFGVSLPGDQTQLVLITNRRNLIARTPPPSQVVLNVLERSSRAPTSLADWTFIRVMPRGPDYLAAYQVSSYFRQRQKAGQTSVEWLSVAYADTQFVIPALNALLWRIGILGIALACGLTVLSGAVSSTFVRPLRTLHRQVERVTLGEWDVNVAIRTGDEIEELSQAFAAMLAEIKRSREALERQIIQTQARATQVELVNEISRSILGTFSIQRLLETTHAQFSKLVRARSIGLVLSKGAMWEVKANHPFPLLSETQSDFWNSVWDTLQQAPQGIVNLESCPHVYAVRLASGDERLGILLIECPPPESDLAELKRLLLSQLAPFLSLAVQHIQLYEQVCNFAAELEHKVEERAAQLEEAHRRLLQSERLAVTGQLAAGVAHEINNPLAIIKNMLQVMRLENAASSATLKVIEEEIDRIARIVRSLLDFARPPATTGPPSNIPQEIQHVLALLATTLRHRQIHVVVDVESQLPPAALSRDSFRQVLLNLLRNAEEAVPNGGQIAIRAKIDASDGRCCIVVEVEDQGEGIAPEVLPHIFEPFVTTKRGEGVGLGLSVSYGLVTAVGGTIEVESERGKGTRFRVILPIAESDNPAE
ncbi:MAG: ATP-binding protein [Candidatus Sumerlaeaceae bacterium]